MMLYLQLFLEFFKTGLFAVGGGMATIPFLYDISDKTGWFTYKDLAHLIAVSESTPGPFAVNIATFTGAENGGLLGAACATLGVVLPSFIIIYTISMFLDNFLEITLIANAFKGIKLAVGLLILNAGLNMLQKMKKTRQSVTILVCALGVMVLVPNFSALSLMITAGVISLALSLGKGGKA